MLTKSEDDKKICGVCGGLSEYTGIDSSIIRIAWAFSAVFFGVGVLAYIIAAIIMPRG